MRRWPLTLRGTGALVLGAGLWTAAHVVGSSEALAFGVLMIALVAASLLSVYLRRRPGRLTRVVRPETVAIDEESAVVVRVSGRSALPTAGGSWSDDLPAGLSGEASGTFSARLLPGIGANDALELSYTVTGIRRGVWEIGPLTVVEHDPFGIARRARRLGRGTSAAVTPRLAPLAPLPRVAGDSGLALTTAERRGQGSDNLIPRPYAPGDSMRRIHWRASARLGDFMVREEEHEASPRAVVVLDRSAARWSPDAASPGADEAFETAVTLCVSAAWRLARDGYLVSVVDGEGAPLASLGVQGAAQSDERHELLSAFAAVGTRSPDALPRLAEVLAGVAAGPLVLITGRLDAADAPLLARVVRQASLPLLFAAAPHGDALDAATRAGWRSVLLEDDAATAWARSLDPGASHGRG
ncbi:DUF58 domain-containing protein [Microbacterium betulae]|uniref:DUF58 domain-containing protein n=1 Tax=Microbacterium betulae TaxID=2981139 RepID=A0AA97FI75_9MICO|nr:DUF58 domain-containing protein [Microbacterium sp. AB]WOF24051.1 DUF58 domain-containing protein [Microbacterium sp. AB]